MDKLPNYNGTIDLISGLRAKNNGNFPLMQAHDVQVTETQRLDEMFKNPESWLPVYDGENEGGAEGGGSGGNYVLELTGESGTLTEEQYQAVVDNFPNVVVKVVTDDNDATFYTPFIQSGSIYNFHISYYNELGDIKIIITSTFTIRSNKTWNITNFNYQFSTGLQLKQITFTDRPSLWTWLQSNWQKILSGVARSQGETLNFNTIEDLSSDNILSQLILSRTQLTYDGNEYLIYSSEVVIDSNQVKIKQFADVSITNNVVSTSSSGIDILPDEYWTATSTSITLTYIE